MRLAIAVIGGLSLVAGSAAAQSEKPSTPPSVKRAQQGAQDAMKAGQEQAGKAGQQIEKKARQVSKAARQEREAVATLRDAQGKEVGTISFRQAPNGLVLEGDLSGLPPGPHAFHIHEVGQCEPPFKTAGGHFNPTRKQHGVDNPKGMHAGDMPNIDVDEKGQARFEMFLPGALSLGSGTAGNLFDKDGSSVIVHDGPDDHHSDPAGNAGDRIACGVVEKSR